MSVNAQFVHLRLHTEYSLRDSVVRIPELMDAVAAGGMPAVAMTDLHNLFGMLKFYRAALRRGLQPIIGADLSLLEPDDRQGPSRLTLLCQSEQGYRNLTRLVSRAWLEGQQRGEPLVQADWLTPQTTSGLIALSGAMQGNVGRLLLNGREALAEQALQRWLDLFGDRFYIELQRLGHVGEQPYLQAAVALAERCDAPVVATNDVRFLQPSDFEAHEVRVCIHDRAQLADPARVRRYTPQQCLRSSDEMLQLFADIPEALANTVQIARRCALTLRLGTAHMPSFPVPAETTAEDFLRCEALQGLQTRMAVMSAAGGETAERYAARLQSELDVICPMGFAGYFLIVADFIRWARDHDVPVGPGRGSGAGSLVAYVLGITDIDPLRYDLLFERFLNPERVSMPDFDVDFCMDGRDRVIDYVAQKYGQDHVSQIITYGSMAAKAVVRDVGRVIGLPYGQVDRVAKLVPFELEMTLDKALEKEPELQRLYRTDEVVQSLIDMARSLEGLTRNAGKHAGGVVISPSVLTDFAPLYCEPGGNNVVTQFDKDDVEAAGLVKFDFLGLRTLTIIDGAVKSINAKRAAQGEPLLSLSALPMNDARTYTLLKSSRTTAVFQLESNGMKDLIRRLQPDCFEDIIALVALFRPGPLQSGMVDDFIDRKKQPGGVIDCLHPQLKPVLAPTYGVILYQEQVMQIAQVLAGYTLGGADLLRRAMGKKSPEEMARQRDVFVSGAVARGVVQNQAVHIFDLMEKFAGYGFNKSHSAAYALLSYQTAYLKAHYPSEFMAAVLSSELDRTDKIVTLIDECAHMGLRVLPPDVNASAHVFDACDPRTIRYGLGAVKGVGEAAVDALVAERVRGGRYQSVSDLCHRIELQRINRRLLEALIRSGSMDTLGPNRATLMDSLGDALRSGEQQTRTAQAGQNDMFGLRTAPAANDPVAARVLPEWTEGERLAGERATLGLYLTGHPIARYERDLPAFVSGRIGDYAAEPKPMADEPVRYGDRRSVTVAGLILEIRRRGSRVSVVLDDRTGRIDVTFSEEMLQRHRESLVPDALVLISGGLRFDDFSDAWRVGARNVQSLDMVRERQARQLLITLPRHDPQILGELAAALTPWRGGACTVSVRWAMPSASGVLTLGDAWRVRAAPGLLEALERLCGSDGAQLRFAPPGEAMQAASAAVV